jgi:hypothetical protein
MRESDEGALCEIEFGVMRAQLRALKVDEYGCVRGGFVHSPDERAHSFRR